ncbi:ornithine cyclodeaminase [Herbaspirillum rubrisubalbicans M1]|uniref:ornithine cyclodeaminase family protein n=1 Tax=Herbaspirillum rubrisubalbicans TaxID=80842 RepID=UPI000739FEE9|nr:NAD(P)-binding domain-containing protein [Herbaspirillum rubrisubalbicans]ALU91538.1 ornithine cyclodeaminase [Herbaspirillum rubrisubalbicans M1]
MSASATITSVPPTLFLTDDDVSQLHSWKDAIEALRAAYAAPVREQMVPPRSMARGDGIWLRTLSAISPSGGHLGSKLISASPRAGCASYLISLFDEQTMALSALIDGNQITAIRTAATAAIAVDALAPQRPLRVAMIGAGFEARSQLNALNAARSLHSVSVFSPTPASRERFAADFRDRLGIDISAVASAQAAVAGADVVICAARSRDESPVLLGQWLEPGMTVISIGSTLPEQREVDVDVIARAGLIVADMVEEVAHDTGDMIAANRAGILFSEKLHSLAELIGGRLAPRSSGQIALYKSVGSALQDVVTAEMLLRRAREHGKGSALPVSIAPVRK